MTLTLDNVGLKKKKKKKKQKTNTAFSVVMLSLVGCTMETISAWKLFYMIFVSYKLLVLNLQAKCNYSSL